MRIAEHSLGPLSPVFGSAVVVWIVCIIISPILLLLRIFRVIKTSDSFIYIFMGTTNLLIGVAGLYNALDHAAKIYYSFIALAGINVLFGLFIFIDAFIRTIPGYWHSK